MNYLLLIQTLIAAIKSVEQLMPASSGKEKFDAAVALVEAVVGEVSPMLPVLASLATMLVNGFRASGLFAAKTAS
jgi:hypothetical protein